MSSNPNSSMFEDLIESGDINKSAEEAISGNGEQIPSGNETFNNVQIEYDNDKSSTGIDFESLLAEKTNGKFKSVDEILQLADKPNTTDINFANETSKKVFEYLKEGKVDEFLNFYQQNQKLTNLDKLDTDNVLKLKMKYENPELSDDEIEDEFNYKYGLEQPDIDEDLDSPEEIAKEKKRFEREKINMERLKKKDLKEAKDFLKSKKEEIVLPNIETGKTQQLQSNDVDEVAVKEYRDKYLNTIPTTIDDIVGFGSKYKDSELEFETTYVIDPNDKAGLKDKMQNFTLQDYFVPRYINDDGTFDTETIAHDLYVIENLDKIIEAHVSQAVNQTKSLFVKGLKNANFQESVSRRLPDEQQASQDEMVNFFFGNT
jgi:hypothetical protein